MTAAVNCVISKAQSSLNLSSLGTLRRAPVLEKRLLWRSLFGPESCDLGARSNGYARENESTLARDISTKKVSFAHAKNFEGTIARNDKSVLEGKHLTFSQNVRPLEIFVDRNPAPEQAANSLIEDCWVARSRLATVMSRPRATDDYRRNGRLSGPIRIQPHFWIAGFTSSTKTA